MRILVIGSGGREHALVWKLAQSAKKPELFIAPGNPGTAELGTNVPIAVTEIDKLVAFAKENAIDLTVVGPEGPLCAGIVDAFAKAGLKAWGPSREAALLEGSKVDMKRFLQRYNIPTAPFRVFNDAAAAIAYIQEAGAPLVIKADGLAAGKGVTVAQTVPQAEEAVRQIMIKQVFGREAGRQVVVEDILRGDEISIFAFCDGNNALLLDTAQDHKQAFDNDQGPNTGGMGVYTPAPNLMREKDWDEVVRRILVPTMSGLKREERPYIGILYMGLMLTDAGPKVIEYNVRFGDPECQPLLLRMKTDFIDIIERCLNGRLDSLELSWDPATAVCVTVAAPGYPGNYPKGIPITNLDAAKKVEGVTIFHAGTATKNGQLVSDGGRVLSVCAIGKDLAQARERAYQAADLIQLEGKHYRRDIGLRQSGRGK
jgi:phosphoribosylamine--glycine ligase